MFLSQGQLKLNESNGNIVTFNEDKPVSVAICRAVSISKIPPNNLANILENCVKLSISRDQVGFSTGRWITSGSLCTESLKE